MLLPICRRGENGEKIIYLIVKEAGTCVFVSMYVCCMHAVTNVASKACKNKALAEILVNQKPLCKLKLDQFLASKIIFWERICFGTP